MRKFIVMVGYAALLTTPLAAQQGGLGSSGPFHIGTDAGYVWYGDLFDFGNDVEFSADDGFMIGLQAGYNFSPGYSLIGHFGYNRSNFELQEGATTVAATGDFNVYLYDANLQFRIPYIDFGWVAPLAQIGVGAITYDFDDDVLDTGSSTDWTWNYGFGADFQITSEVGMWVMLKDYVTSLAWDDSDAFDFDDAVDDNVAHNWALSFGLGIGF